MAYGFLVYTRRTCPNSIIKRPTGVSGWPCQWMGSARSFVVHPHGVCYAPLPWVPSVLLSQHSAVHCCWNRACALCWAAGRWHVTWKVLEKGEFAPCLRCAKFGMEVEDTTCCHIFFNGAMANIYNIYIYMVSLGISDLNITMDSGCMLIFFGGCKMLWNILESLR